MITVTSLAAEKIKGIKAAQAAPAEVGLGRLSSRWRSG